MADEIEEQIKALRKWVYILLAISVGGGGLASTGKFTSADGDQMEQRIMLEMRKMEINIRNDMPPVPTRVRIRNLERCMEKKCLDFSADVTGW